MDGGRWGLNQPIQNDASYEAHDNPASGTSKNMLTVWSQVLFPSCGFYVFKVIFYDIIAYKRMLRSLKKKKKEKT